MSTGATVILVLVVLIVLALVGWMLWNQNRRRQLRERFGPEYDRLVGERENRTAAERELMQRERRHAEFDIKPLSDTDRDRYSQEWMVIQQQFVDQPENAVAGAEQLVTAVMAVRGYPTEGYQQQAADLSVRHSAAVDHYRSAHHILNGEQTGTEELREAMVHYRSLFEDLLDSDVNGRRGVVDGVTERARRN